MIRVVHSGSRIRILTFYPSRIPDPDPGVKKAPDSGSRIRFCNTALEKIEDSELVEGGFELGTFCDLSISSRATSSQGK
jgi:hypothetical protein